MATVAPDELKFWLAFARVGRIGSVRAGLIEAHFGTMAAAWKASAGELRAAGLDRGTVSAIVGGRDDISPDSELEGLAKTGISALTWKDDAYPARLKEVDDKPPVLFVRGELRPEDEWSVAIVGTRRATPYGRQAAEHFATDLAHHKITVVSGLARGIDAVAHRTALAAGGRTIAVLACGLDVVYPPEHSKLAQEIAQAGALLSDYPLGTQPHAEYFPRRNRILSGISLGVLVAEGDIDSGSLITARYAIDQNREVFAVPGSIYSPTYRGTNKLIRDGEAKLVATAEDILEELNLTMTTTTSHQMELRQAMPADATEASLLSYISNEPIHIDDVQRESGLSIAEVSSALAMLELKGMVHQVGPMNFVRAREIASVPYTAN